MALSGLSSWHSLGGKSGSVHRCGYQATAQGQFVGRSAAERGQTSAQESCLGPDGQAEIGDHCHEIVHEPECLVRSFLAVTDPGQHVGRLSARGDVRGVGVDELKVILGDAQVVA